MKDYFAYCLPDARVGDSFMVIVQWQHGDIVVPPWCERNQWSVVNDPNPLNWRTGSFLYTKTPDTPNCISFTTTENNEDLSFCEMRLKKGDL